MASAPATTKDIPSISPRLSRFQQAVETVYGDLSDSTIKNPETWTPPPNSGGHKGRYLWTDAFGVLNLITLHREHKRLEKQNTPQPQSHPEEINTAADTQETAQTDGLDSTWTNDQEPQEDTKYLTLARRLAETVHDVLGRTRDGRARLPGATDQNPVGGGLRIGKLEERGPDGDGQYHHYLTIWMFALNRLSLATNDPKHNDQAVNLAKAIHAPFFVNRKSDTPRMVWKVKMDLSSPLVASEGNLDPIDGYVVFRLLQATAARFNEKNRGVLREEISDYHRVILRKGEQFVSSDPLDLGMSLWTAHWFADKENWATNISEKCFDQICRYPRSFIRHETVANYTFRTTDNLFEINRYLERPIKYRLAFREFGTCVGILCHSEQEKGDKGQRAPDLAVYGDAIVQSWEPYMDLALAAGLTEDDLKPITRAMYATALIPGGEFVAFGYFLLVECVLLTVCITHTAFRRGYLGSEPVA